MRRKRWHITSPARTADTAQSVRWRASSWQHKTNGKKSSNVTQRERVRNRDGGDGGGVGLRTGVRPGVPGRRDQVPDLLSAARVGEGTNEPPEAADHEQDR